MKNDSLNNLQTIPGVGKSIARALYNIGIRSASDLEDKDTEESHRRSNEFVGKKQDSCLLYVFRCAVYFANPKNPNIELLQWWNWKDRK